MRASLDQILTINLAGTTLAFHLAARIHLLPRLASLSPRVVLPPILLLRSLRRFGLMFLAPGGVHPGMPPRFAYPAALGDLIASLLAFACQPALLGGWRAARPLVWVFNLFGTLDLVAAVTMATLHGASAFMGPAYWIPAFWVPALLVTHDVTFLVLWRRWP